VISLLARLVPFFRQLSGSAARPFLLSGSLKPEKPFPTTVSAESIESYYLLADLLASIRVAVGSYPHEKLRIKPLPVWARRHDPSASLQNLSGI